MKKVLILAYDFPPFISVGGLRPYSWFNHLNEFGWLPAVITRQWSSTDGTPKSYVSPGISEKNLVEHSNKGRITRTPYRPNLANKILIKYGERRFSFMRKAITAWFEFLQFVFPIGPRAGIYKEAQRALRNEKTDLIIASGSPYVLFRYASILSKRHKIPWIADYRDPWSEDISLQKKKVLKYWSRLQEKKTLKSVSAVTTVSEFVKSKIEKTIGEKKYFIIPNGYDRELIKKVKKGSPSKDFLSIGFAGTIYNWNPIWVFLGALNEFVREQREVKIKMNFFGTNINRELLRAIPDHYPDLKEVVRVYPQMPQQEVLEYLSKQHLLLLFNYYFYMGTKIYEYLALKRRIILCFSKDPKALLLKKKFYHFEENGNAGHNPQEKLISSTNGGLIVKDSDELKKLLLQHWIELKNERDIPCKSHGVERYSRKNQVCSLAKAFDEVCKINSRE